MLPDVVGDLASEQRAPPLVAWTEIREGVKWALYLGPILLLAQKLRGFREVVRPNTLAQLEKKSLNKCQS